MKLRTRLFLLFLVSGVVPLLLVLLAGSASLRHQRGLWSIATVDSALEASLRSNRDLVDRTLRSLEDLGQNAASGLDWTEARPEIEGQLAALTADPSIDFAAFLSPGDEHWDLLAATSPIDAEALTARVRSPETSAEGPQRSRPIRWTDESGDLLVVPTFVWTRSADLATPDASDLAPIGCVLLGSRLGVGTFGDLEEVSGALVNYRRFGELGGLLALAQILVLAIALVASLAVSGLLARIVARRISTPVENLVDVLATVGSPGPGPALHPTGIPELHRIGEAIAGMRARLAEYEEQAREVERVQASQETARFVAHEIRNALTPVTAGIAVLERRVEALPEESRPQGRRALEAIRREAARMASLAASFSEYAHLPVPRPTWIDPREALVAASREVPPGVVVRTELPESAPALFIDRDELERLLRNLVKNACEAMGGEGQLEVSLRTEGRKVVIEVRDDGPGMDEGTLRQVLQPGFTTKEGGSGLGLSLVRGSVIRYGGKLELESIPGRGTTVRIRFPLDPISWGEPGPTTMRSEAPGVGRAKETRPQQGPRPSELEGARLDREEGRRDEA